MNCVPVKEGLGAEKEPLPGTWEKFEQLPFCSTKVHSSQIASLLTKASAAQRLRMEKGEVNDDLETIAGLKSHGQYFETRDRVRKCSTCDAIHCGDSAVSSDGLVSCLMYGSG